jgi:hypothetical protein
LCFFAKDLLHGRCFYLGFSSHAQAEAQQLVDAETARARDWEKTIAEAEVGCSHVRQVQQVGDLFLHILVCGKPT